MLEQGFFINHVRSRTRWVSFTTKWVPLPSDFLTMCLISNIDNVRRHQFADNAQLYLRKCCCMICIEKSPRRDIVKLLVHVILVCLFGFSRHKIWWPGAMIRLFENSMNIRMGSSMHHATLLTHSCQRSNMTWFVVAGSPDPKPWYKQKIADGIRQSIRSRRESAMFAAWP